jgi:hypothetical protein
VSGFDAVPGDLHGSLLAFALDRGPVSHSALDIRRSSPSEATALPAAWSGALVG